MALGEDERPPAALHALAIPLQDGITGCPRTHCEVVGTDRQMRAHREAYQILGKREGKSFVEIVDAPNQAAFLVAPRSEVFHVEIADGQLDRSSRELGNGRLPSCDPSVKGGAKERKHTGRHLSVLTVEI